MKMAVLSIWKMPDFDKQSGIRGLISGHTYDQLLLNMDSPSVELGMQPSNETCSQRLIYYKLFLIESMLELSQLL